MKVLVTGASGFLGRAVVAAFLERGHRVRALVRPSARIEKLGWPAEVDVFRADLRVHPDLAAAFDGTDALVHLAAVVLGDDATHFASTIGGTDRLLEAMSRSQTRRMVLASSFSVYGWGNASGTLDETTPLAPNIYECGAYAIAKLWQERIAHRMSQAHGWELTILRPGVIWGPGHLNLPIVGPAVTRIQVIIGVGRLLPLTYVENCAEGFVRAAEDPRAIGEVFNIVDDDGVPAWRFAGEILRRSRSSRIRVVIPYSLTLISAWAATAVSRMLFQGRGKLPSLLMPPRLALFRPLRFSNRRLCEKLNWQPRWSFEQTLERVFATRELSCHF